MHNCVSSEQTPGRPPPASDPLPRPFQAPPWDAPRRPRPSAPPAPPFRPDPFSPTPPGSQTRQNVPEWRRPPPPPAARLPVPGLSPRGSGAAPPGSGRGCGRPAPPMGLGPPSRDERGDTRTPGGRQRGEEPDPRPFAPAGPGSCPRTLCSAAGERLPGRRRVIRGWATPDSPRSRRAPAGPGAPTGSPSSRPGALGPRGSEGPSASPWSLAPV